MSVPTARMGRSGLRVSRLCLGSMVFGSKQWKPWCIERDEALPIIKRALDLGINFIDTADVYSLGECERIIGEAVEGRREEVVLATKVYNPMASGHANDGGLSRKHVLSAIDGSLERFGTEYLDLYFVHRYDREQVDADEMLSTLSGLVDDGRVRYLGASTMFAWEFARLLYRQRERGWREFSVMQNHYNLVYREEEREMIPLCRAEGVGLMHWSPQARGFLAGRESRERSMRAQTDQGRWFYGSDEDHEIANRVDKLAEEKGATPSQVALAWLLNRPGTVCPIVGVDSVEQLEQAVGAFDVKLTDREMEFLEEPYKPKPLAGWYQSKGVPRVHLSVNEPF